MTPLLAVLMVVGVMVMMWIWTQNKRFQRSIDSLNKRVSTNFKVSFETVDRIDEEARLRSGRIYNTPLTPGFPGVFTGKMLLTCTSPTGVGGSLILQLAQYLVNSKKINQDQMLALINFDIPRLGEFILPLKEVLEEHGREIDYFHSSEPGVNLIGKVLNQNLIYVEDYELLSDDISKIALLAYSEISLALTDVSYIFDTDYSGLYDEKESEKIYNEIINNISAYRDLMEKIIELYRLGSPVIPDNVILKNLMSLLPPEEQEKLSHFHVFYVTSVSVIHKAAPYGSLIDLTNEQLVVIQRLYQQGYY